LHQSSRFIFCEQIESNKQCRVLQRELSHSTLGWMDALQQFVK